MADSARTVVTSRHSHGIDVSSGHENALEGSVRVPNTVRALGLGAFGRTQRGQAAFDDGRESPTVLWPPLRLAWLRRERGSVGVVCPWFSRVVELDEGSGCEGDWAGCAPRFL